MVRDAEHHPHPFRSSVGERDEQAGHGVQGGDARGGRAALGAGRGVRLTRTDERPPSRGAGPRVRARAAVPAPQR